MALAIHLLGVPRVERDGNVVAAPRGHKAWGLLAYLLLSRAAVGRKHLAALLFADAEDPLAALRWNLSELRRLVGAHTLRGERVALSLDCASYVDVHVVRSGSCAEALCVPSLDNELLEGMDFAASPAFEVWLATERRHLQAATEAVLREAALARLAAGESREAADLAGRLVRRNPLDENYQGLLVRALAAAGDGVGAARQVAACRELCGRELGVEPGATLEAAARTVTSAPTARPASGRAAAFAQLEAGEAALAAGALEAGLHCLRRAVVEADATGDPQLRARARVALGGALVHAARGRDEEGATVLHEALTHALDPPSPLAAAACRELAYIEFLRGRYDRATAWLERAERLAVEDPCEQARIATVKGATLTDTGRYGAAMAKLREAERLSAAMHDTRQEAYALSMLGRALLLYGDHAGASDALDRSIALAQERWLAFLPWPQSLRAEVDLMRGEAAKASERLEHGFALACQLGDPCWEGIAGRGLGRVAMARGEWRKAAEILVDAVARCARMSDAYLWGRGYALDALCGLAVAQRMPQASAWIAELQNLAARGGMRELVVRSHLHRAGLGDRAAGAASRVLAREIDNPALRELVATVTKGETAPTSRAAPPWRR